MLVELLLKTLIGEIDAQLFKRIYPQYFKPKDIQDPNKLNNFPGSLIAAYRAVSVVNLSNEPGKERAIEPLDESANIILGVNLGQYLSHKQKNYRAYCLQELNAP
jgi:hypothetical protein